MPIRRIVASTLIVGALLALAWFYLTSRPGHQPVAGAPASLDLSLADGRLPSTLSQLGVFADLPALEPAPGVFRYEVRYPLWSDGTLKERHAFLPAGSRVEVDEAGEFRFPTGTLLAKTFSSPCDVPGREHRRIETRILYKHGQRWVFATYVWEASGLDARLTDGEDREMPFVLPGCESRYVVPGRVTCIQCHGGVADTSIGFSSVQLDEGTVSRLRAGGHLPAGADPLPRRDIQARSEAERAALGYIHGNCAHCHNPRSPAYTGDELDLRHFHVVEETVGAEPERLVHREAPSLVTPRAPEKSVLFRLFDRSYSTEHDSDREKRMPPVGNDSVDPHGAQILARWIAALNG